MNSQQMAVSMLYPLMKTIEYKGYDFRKFCEYASFDEKIMRDVDARIDASELERLMQAAAAYTNDEFFGLYQGSLTESADLGVLGYVMMHSENVEAAMKAFQRYNIILCSGYNVDWDIRGQEVWLRLSTMNDIPMSRHCMEDMASSLYQLTQRMSNRSIELREVHFTHKEPSKLEPYNSIFGVIPQFEKDMNAICMSTEVLEYPILYSDSRLREAFEPIAEEIRAKLIKGNQLKDQVFGWISRCMPLFFPTLQQTAEHFKVSTRTLQAKLKEEGTTFNEVSAAVRKQTAVSYLRRNEYSISEIAYMLHFSEPSAFHSTFKKWTGIAPGQYRSMQRERVSDETG